MPAIPNALRDRLVAEFRRTCYEKTGFVPFLHQAAWQAATEGWLLAGRESRNGEPSMTVRLPDGRTVQQALVPRPGGPARVVANLAAYKGGKSLGSAMWATGFAAVPQGRVQIVGLEYDTCAPEFEYLAEALCSDRGMKLPYTAYKNQPREGRMYLEFPNGARFEARSWERRETLKGKEVDAYIFAEAYQLPGLSCYTDIKQNLVARDGWAIFPTTPDRPWVKELHDRAHSGRDEYRAWVCICGVPRSVNPYTFDQQAMDQDDPDKGGLLTREKFAIAWLGQLGEFVGRVYTYQRGSRVFTPDSHPWLWRPGARGCREDLRVPEGWAVVGGADTGTFSSVVFVAFSPEGEAFVLDEVPNYRYLAGVPELDETLTIPAWAARVHRSRALWGASRFLLADKNSQFKAELRHYDLHLVASSTNLETRTEIAREYFQQGAIWLAPWLEILPYELEHARWPDEVTAAGRFARLKEHDHTLDCLEHVLSKRPRGRRPSPPEPVSIFGPRRSRTLDRHLGAL